MSQFRKGVAYSVIAIVALIGLIGVLGGLAYQSSTGTGYAEGISKISGQDSSTEKLEFTKSMVLQAARFSTIHALMEVTKNGGTLSSENYWCCDNVPQPVSKEEFESAISGLSLDYMNVYINSFNKDPSLAEKSITLSEPKSMSVSLADLSTCDAENCNFLSSTLSEERIDVSSPVKTNYKGSLDLNDAGPVRAALFHKVLYNEFSKNKLLQEMSSTMATACGEDVEIKFKLAVRMVCQELTQAFMQEGVDPKDLKCTTTEISPPQGTCTRQKYDSKSSSESKLASGIEKAILIHLEDKKYEPLGEGTPMEWNVKMSVDVEEPECATAD